MSYKITEKQKITWSYCLHDCICKHDSTGLCISYFICIYTRIKVFSRQADSSFGVKRFAKLCPHFDVLSGMQRCSVTEIVMQLMPSRAADNELSHNIIQWIYNHKLQAKQFKNCVEILSPRN